MDGPNQGFDKLMQSVKRINIQYANRNAKGKFFHPYIHFTQQFFPSLNYLISLIQRINPQTKFCSAYPYFGVGGVIFQENIYACL